MCSLVRLLTPPISMITRLSEVCDQRMDCLRLHSSFESGFARGQGQRGADIDGRVAKPDAGQRGRQLPK